MVIYDYIFYKVYMFTKRLGNFDVGFSTTLGFSFLLMVNSIEILKIAGILTQDGWGNINPFLIVFWAGILFFNYFRFNRRFRYRAIVKKFRNEPSKQKLLGAILVSSYAILTLVLIFLI